MEDDLVRWLASPRRRPLILRGARQVGKTWLARRVVAESGRALIELNFERTPGIAQVFDVRDPRQVLAEMSLLLDREIDPASAVLFLDEIQAAPEVLSRLRWFAEELPDLPVIAAGSLLEFALAAHEHSVPVGRTTYRYLQPMAFDEYLQAHGQQRLLDTLQAWSPGERLSDAAFERGLHWHDRFAMVGGMPAVVAADVEQADPAACRQLQTDLVSSFRDDFAKYVGRMDPGVLDVVLSAVARQLGQKFVYAHVGEGLRHEQSRRGLELLEAARVVTLAPHAKLTGVPIGGEINLRRRKALLLDIGLVHAILRTPAGAVFPTWSSLAPAVRGALTEQLAGQQLRALEPAAGSAPALHFWQRGDGRAGEVDFVVQIDHRIVPVEIKSGAAGAMKSLHQLMFDKRLELAVRVDRQAPSLQTVDVKTTQGDPVRYHCLNLPAFMLWRCAALVRQVES